MLRFLPATALALTLAACSPAADPPPARGRSEAAAPAPAAVTAAPAAPEQGSGLVQGTPPGGLRDWTAAIRSGLDSLPSLAASDPATAQSRVLTLYATRQEYLEMYWGDRARLATTPRLEAAISESEQRFHALMAELAKDAPAPATVRALTDSLRAQVARVDEASASAPGPLTPWAVEEGT